MVVALAMLVIGLVIGAGVATLLSRPAPSGGQQSNPTSSDDQQVQRQDVGVLYQMLNKLADVSGNKSLKLQSQAFSTLHDVFALAAQPTNITPQYNALCNTPQARSAFTFNGSLWGSHNRTCIDYGALAHDTDLLYSQGLGLVNYQQAFNTAMWDLVEMDNTIVSDP